MRGQFMEASFCCAYSGSLRKQATVDTMLPPNLTSLYDWGAVLSAPPPPVIPV